MSRKLIATATLILLVVFLVPITAASQENEGECPPGYVKISTGFSGLSWTADADYQVVILVGGPPGAENQDPDGRDKTFFNVEEGDILSRVAHDISHICVLAVTTTTAEETTLPEETTIPTVPTTPPTTVSDTPPTTPTTVVVNPICIDCNNATSADLQQLQGVDATLAQAIIDNRPYFSLQDLVTKGVMTPGQILLILAVNAGTGAFASDLCLQAVGVTTTTVVVSVPGNPTTSIIGTVPAPSTVGTVDVAELPLTGANAGEMTAGAISLLVIGLILVQAVRQRGNDF